MNLEVPVLLIFSVGFFPQGPLWFLSNFSSFAIFLSTFATMFLWYADDKGRHFSSCISYSEELCSLGLWFSLFRVIIADYFPYTLGFGQTETRIIQQFGEKMQLGSVVEVHEFLKNDAAATLGS